MHWLFEWYKGKKIYYEEVLRKLAEKKIDYLLVGGMAVTFYNVPPRFTMDVDLMISFVPENVEKFMKILTGLGYKPKVPVNPQDFADPKKREDWVNNKNMKVFAFYHPDREREIVDVFIQHPLDYEDMKKAQKTVNVKGIKINIPSKKHLIALKKIAGRDQDLLDIKNLEALPEGDEFR